MTVGEGRDRSGRRGQESQRSARAGVAAVGEGRSRDRGKCGVRMADVRRYGEFGITRGRKCDGAASAA
ncbi:hypothetical protein J2Z45_002686 [Cohnella lubricantis]|nr:hypothetical protein [Cohnella lubricantis]